MDSGLEHMMYKQDSETAGSVQPGEGSYGKELRLHTTTKWEGVQ